MRRVVVVREGGAGDACRDGEAEEDHDVHASCSDVVRAFFSSIVVGQLCCERRRKRRRRFKEYRSAGVYHCSGQYQITVQILGF